MNKRLIFWLFLIATAITVLCETIIQVQQTIFFYNNQAWDLIKELWAWPTYWLWAAVLIFLLIKRNWAIIPLVLSIYGAATNFYRVFFMASSNISYNWFWLLILACSVSALLMLIFGFIYYAIYLWPNRKLAGH